MAIDSVHGAHLFRHAANVEGSFVGGAGWGILLIVLVLVVVLAVNFASLESAARGEKPRTKAAIGQFCSHSEKSRTRTRTIVQDIGNTRRAKPA